MSLPSIRFRRARPADLPAIVALLADDDLGRGREDPSQPPNPRYVAAFAAIAADPNQLLAVAVDGEGDEGEGAVCGCMQLTFIPGLSRQGAWRCQIEAVRIAAGRRGAGLGRAMFDWAIGEARRRGCSLLQLTSDKARADAHRFYRSLGFVASHEGMKLEL